MNSFPVVLSNIFTPVKLYAQSAVLGSADISVLEDATDGASFWSKLWPYLLGALIVAGVSFLFFLIAKKRKREED